MEQRAPRERAKVGSPTRSGGAPASREVSFPLAVVGQRGEEGFAALYLEGKSVWFAGLGDHNEEAHLRGALGR